MSNKKSGFRRVICGITVFMIVISMSYIMPYNMSYASDNEASAVTDGGTGEDNASTVTDGSINNDKGSTVTNGGIDDDKAIPVTGGGIDDDKASTVTGGGIDDDKASTVTDGGIDGGADTVTGGGVSDNEAIPVTLGAIDDNGATIVTVGDTGCDHKRIYDVFNDPSIEGDVIIEVENDLTDTGIISVDPDYFSSITIESSDPNVNRGFGDIKDIRLNGIPTILKNMGTDNAKTRINGGGNLAGDMIPSVNVTVENCKFKSLTGSKNTSVAGDINLNCSGPDTNIKVITGGINLTSPEKSSPSASVGGDINLTIDGGTYSSIYGVSDITGMYQPLDEVIANRAVTAKGNVTISVDNAAVTNLLCGQGCNDAWGSGNAYIGTILTTKGKTTIKGVNSSFSNLIGGVYNSVGPPSIPVEGSLEYHLSDMEINLKESTVSRDIRVLNFNDANPGVNHPFEQRGNVTVSMENSSISGSLLGGNSTSNGSIQYQLKGTSTIGGKLIGNTLDPTNGNADIYNTVPPGNAIRLNTDTGITVSALGGFTDLGLGGPITVTGDQDSQNQDIDIIDCNAAKLTIKYLPDWTEGEGVIVSTATAAPALQENDFIKGWTEEKPALQFNGTKPGGWYLYDIPMVTVTFDPAPGTIQNVTGSKVLNYIKGIILPAADIPTPTTTAANTHFAGWYTDINDESTKISTTNLPIINTDVTYHAKWQQDSGGGGGSGGGSGGGGSQSIGGGSKEPPAVIEEHLAYINGYPDGTFRPDNPMTRAEVATMFYQVLEDKTGNDSNQFSDVDRNSWYAEAVSVLHNKGILLGYEDGTFKPDSYVTRAEFAAIVSRFETLKEGNKQFSDVSEDYWAYGYIASAAEKGIINGYPDGTFQPDRSISRAEAVSMTNRALDRKPDREFLDWTDNVKRFSDLWKSHWAYYDVMESSNSHEYTIKDDQEKWVKLE